MKILIVDDDLSVRKSLKLQVERIGHHVLTAADGLSALKMLMDHEGIDAVITDYRMPILGGKDWIDLLRHYHPDLNIIVVSGYGFVKEKLGEKIIFLEKPFGPENLNQVLDQVEAFLQEPHH